MDIDVSSFFKAINEQLSSDASIQVSMEAIINNCASYEPKKWIPYRSLNYGRDMTALMDALSKIENAEDVSGLYVGIFNPVVEGEPTSDMYVVGCTECDAEDEHCEWVFSHLSPEKHAIYFASQVHGDIYRLAYQDNGLGNNAEYPLCLAYTALVVNRVARKLKLSKTIAAGFDSGDIITVYTAHA